MNAHHSSNFRTSNYNGYSMALQTPQVQSLPSSFLSGHYYRYFDMNNGYRNDELNRALSDQIGWNVRPSNTLNRPLLDMDFSMLQHSLGSQGRDAGSAANGPSDFKGLYQESDGQTCARSTPSPGLPAWLTQKASLGDTRTPARYRIVYNEKQKMELEKEFRFHQYISTQRKKQLAEELHLSERQVKVWFQNRRSKDIKDRYQIAALKGCVANCAVENTAVMRCPHCQDCSANCASKETVTK